MHLQQSGFFPENSSVLAYYSREFFQFKTLFILRKIKQDYMIIAGNWKMNLDLQNALNLVQSISKEKISESIEVRMAVPSLYLTKLRSFYTRNKCPHACFLRCTMDNYCSF